MTELNPDVPEKPIQVAPSPLSDQASTATRDILLIISVLPALIAVLGTKDLVQIVAFIQSTQFAPVLGLLVGTGVVLYRQWLARRKHANELKMAKSADDRVAVVVQKP
jgi:hypothetical protein